MEERTWAYKRRMQRHMTSDRPLYGHTRVERKK
jgi:hypothetical protein